MSAFDDKMGKMFTHVSSTQAIREELLDLVELGALLLTKADRTLHDAKIIPFLYKH